MLWSRVGLYSKHFISVLWSFIFVAWMSNLTLLPFFLTECFYPVCLHVHDYQFKCFCRCSDVLFACSFWINELLVASWIALWEIANVYWLGYMLVESRAKLRVSCLCWEAGVFSGAILSAWRSDKDSFWHVYLCGRYFCNKRLSQVVKKFNQIAYSDCCVRNCEPDFCLNVVDFCFVLLLLRFVFWFVCLFWGWWPLFALI